MKEINTALLLLIIANQKVVNNELIFIKELLYGIAINHDVKLDVERQAGLMSDISKSVLDEYEDMLNDLEKHLGSSFSNASNNDLNVEELLKVLLKNRN